MMRGARGRRPLDFFTPRTRGNGTLTSDGAGLVALLHRRPDLAGAGPVGDTVDMWVRWSA